MPAIVPKSLEQCRRDHYQLLDDLARDAWRTYCGIPFALLYLCGRKGRDSHDCLIWSKLWVATETTEEGTHYVRPEPLSRAMTVDQLRATLADWLRNEPCYTYAD